MTLVRKLLIVIGLLSIILVSVSGFTGWNYYADGQQAKLETAVTTARAQGQRQMLNTIYQEANLRGAITLASFLNVDEDEDGRLDRGDAINLILAPAPSVTTPPDTAP